MTSSLLNRPVSKAEESQTEAAWNAGERGKHPLVAAAARAREWAEAAYEAAYEQAGRDWSPQAEAAERDLVLARNQARHVWRVLYLDVEGDSGTAATRSRRRRREWIPGLNVRDHAGASASGARAQESTAAAAPSAYRAVVRAFGLV
jgi:hypothetical protein